jgi:hypothetical protein
MKQNDIYYGTWGYEAQFAEFYQVVGKTSSGKSAKLRHIGKTRVSPATSPMDYGSVVADPSTNGDQGTKTARIKEMTLSGKTEPYLPVKHRGMRLTLFPYNGQAISEYNHH